MKKDDLRRAVLQDLADDRDKLVEALDDAIKEAKLLNHAELGDVISKYAKALVTGNQTALKVIDSLEEGGSSKHDDEDVYLDEDELKEIALQEALKGD